MNTFFSNIVINLNVLECHKYQSISRNISDPILKAIVKYRNHLSIKAFKKGSRNSKDNYRPISILKKFTKVFENIV